MNWTLSVQYSEDVPKIAIKFGKKLCLTWYWKESTAEPYHIVQIQTEATQNKVGLS